MHSRCTDRAMLIRSGFTGGAIDHDFRGWYVNLEEPWHRTAIGFDSRDNLLDIVIAPDLSSWQWKDEDELAWAVETGRHRLDEAATFCVEGERVIQRLRRREPPFDQPWPDWRPDPAWSAPVLPPAWKDYVQARLTETRLRASRYPLTDRGRRGRGAQ